MNTQQSFDDLLKACLTADRLPFDTNLEASRAAIHQRIQNSASQAPVKVRQLWTSPMRWAAAAASIAAIAFISFVALEVEFESTDALANIDLPDGSTIALDAQTAGSFNRLTWLVSRKVNLDRGHAFFQVEKGSDFSVYCPDGVVSVLGTSFDIRIAEQGFAVKCKTGKVGVRSTDGRKNFTLTAGDYAALEGGEWTEGNFTAAYADTWTSGVYQFENAEISDVLTVLGDAFAYKITLRDVLIPAAYTGSFDASKNLSEVLEIVCKPMGLTYTIDEAGKTIIITNI